jgi:hypothetical protein
VYTVGEHRDDRHYFFNLEPAIADSWEVEVDLSVGVNFTPLV